MPLRSQLLALVVLACIPVIGVTTSLAASVILTWHAPGDDSLSGSVSGYDLRYSRQPITPANFGQAIAAANLPIPGQPGLFQSARIDALLSGQVYFFALKSVDHAGNWSVMSNVISRWSSAVAETKLTLALRFSSPWPNPAREGAQFRMELPDPMRVTVEVFDVNGRRVRTLLDEPRGAGVKNLTFDLRDERGARLAQGIYLVRAQLGEAAFIRRLTVTR